MSESLRRFQRYSLPPGALKSQRIKVPGVVGTIKGWSDCMVKDVSVAGALILSKTLQKLGDKIVLELTPHQGEPMLFQGEVVNLGKDHNSGMHKLGIKLFEPKAGSEQSSFLETLSERYPESR